MKNTRKKIIFTTAVLAIMIAALSTLALYVIDPRNSNRLLPAEDKAQLNRTSNPIPPLRQITFFNRFYSHYSSFSPADSFLSSKFHADIPGLSFLEGEKQVKKHDKKQEVWTSGKKITWCVWANKTSFNKYIWNWIELELQTKNAVKISFYAIPRPIGFVDYLQTVFNEGIKKKIPNGPLIFQTTIDTDNKKTGTKIDIDKPAAIGFPLNFKHERQFEKIPPAGMMIRITPLRNTALNIKLKRLEIMDRRIKPFNGMPSAHYYKYGGADRRKMSSVFIPAGSTLTYSIPIETHSKGEILLDGYFGSVGEKPLILKIFENTTPLVIRPAGKTVSYFKGRLQTETGTIKLTIQVEGSPGLVGVVGNLSFFRPFKDNRKKNIVLYLVDALRADMGGATDELFPSYFEDGAVFTSAYANATFTAYSIPTLFTGRYTFTLIGKNGELPHVAGNKLLLAEYLKSKGYTTAAFINNPWPDHTNSTQGFDFIYHCWSPVAKSSPYPTPGEYKALKYGDMETFLRKFTRENRNKPVFIYIHTMEPHVSYEIPLEKRKYSANADRRVLQELFEKVAQSPAYPVLVNPTDKQLSALKAMYKDDVLTAYDFFKLVNQHLENNLTWNSSSLYIFTADHGERFYEHGSWIHGPPDMYQEVLRIPLMMKGAGVTPGIFNRNVQLTDVFPTIMNWLGDSPQGNFVGRSLLETIDIERKSSGGQGGTSDRFIYADGAGDLPHYAYIEGKIKVIVKDKAIEVYDLEKDRGETVNLSQNTQYKPIIRKAQLFRQKYKRQLMKSINGFSDQERERLKSLGYIR